MRQESGRERLSNVRNGPDIFSSHRQGIQFQNLPLIFRKSEIAADDMFQETSRRFLGQGDHHLALKEPVQQIGSGSQDRYLP